MHPDHEEFREECDLEAPVNRRLSKGNSVANSCKVVLEARLEACSGLHYASGGLLTRQYLASLLLRVLRLTVLARAKSLQAGGAAAQSRLARTAEAWPGLGLMAGRLHEQDMLAHLLSPELLCFFAEGSWLASAQHRPRERYSLCLKSRPRVRYLIAKLT